MSNTKKRPTPQAIHHRYIDVDIALAPNLECPHCGLVQRAHDFQQLNNGWRLDCSGCGAVVVEIIPHLPVYTPK
jgi:hypothetical protein